MFLRTFLFPLVNFVPQPGFASGRNGNGIDIHPFNACLCEMLNKKEPVLWQAGCTGG